MALFESMLTLLLLAIVLLHVARKSSLPYPAMLALAGVGVAALPWAPDIEIDPHLALALFIAPALLDAAYDLPPRELRRNWVPLLALAAGAVLVTTAIVAWAAVALTGMPVAAAIALGAIVAPPDAAAAAAMLGRFNLPRRTVSVLKGESLLNDAVALLIFAGAVGTVGAVGAGGSFATMAPGLALAVPGGVLAGIAAGKLYLVVSPRFAGTLGGTLFEFVATFGVWVIAERLHLSAILAVVAYGMTVARYVPEREYFGVAGVPPVRQSFLVSWCGMRGLVTLATAIALPETFPARNLIVLSAFAVILGTLVLQGLTLGPMIKWLGFTPDGSFESDVATARLALLDAAVHSLDGRNEDDAARLRADYAAARKSDPENVLSEEYGDSSQLRFEAILAQRRKLHELRRSGTIDDDVFHVLEQELDWQELAHSPRERLEIVEG